MAYRNNVQRLCDANEIQNPIQEKDLRIAKMDFMQGGSLTVTIVATDMNRGARLFLESLTDFGYGGTHVFGEKSILFLTNVLKLYAKDYFAELAEDAGTGKRPLIYAILSNDILEITWK